MHPTGKSSAFYHPELDVLRFWAFLMVFACHASSRLDFPTRIPAALQRLVFRAGACGVDLFFCLSAYLITEILLRERRIKGSLDVRSFYVRRILRIWPLYFVFLAFTIVVAPIFMKIESLSWPQAIMFLSLVGNWAYLLGPVHSSVGILWSVSIEEQFYLTWPLLIKRHALNLRQICIVLLLTATLYRAFLVSRHSTYDSFWMGTFSRIDAICLGALIALWLDGRTPNLSRFSRVWLIVGGF